MPQLSRTPGPSDSSFQCLLPVYGIARVFPMVWKFASTPAVTWVDQLAKASCPQGDTAPCASTTHALQ